MSANGNVVELAGRRFGYLLVKQRNGRIGKAAAWLCECDCGQKVTVRSDRLLQARRKSCGINGHKFKFNYSTLKYEPGFTAQHSLEYSSWRSMLERCSNPKHKNWKLYGGRGITVHPAWRESFATFFKDMGPRPSRDYSIDRYPDQNGNYEPNNCRWATADQQRRNMRNNVYVTYEGERILLMDLVQRFSVPRGVVSARVKLGWPLEQALLTPVLKKEKKPPVKRKHRPNTKNHNFPKFGDPIE